MIALRILLIIGMFVAMGLGPTLVALAYGLPVFAGWPLAFILGATVTVSRTQ